MKKRKRLQSNWQHNESGERKEDIQVESLKRKRSEPVTPNAKEPAADGLRKEEQIV